MATLNVPEFVPPPAQDCERLNEAFRGSGTDENDIIQILTQRDAAQRKKIRETYQELYNNSLIDCLSSELSGDFRKAVVLWSYDPAERDARLVNKALRSHKEDIKNLQVIVEVACATSPHHLVAVRQAYCGLFGCSLEEDIASRISHPIQKILVSLVRSYRYDKETVDSDIANIEAAKLHDAIEARKLDDEVIIQILSTRNIFQLKETFKRYNENYGTSVDQDIIASGDDLLEKVMKVVVLCLNSPEKHFAEVVRTAVLGLGTDEDALTRVIVTRAEIDLWNIRDEYLYSYKSSIADDIIDDTSGDYKRFLMALLGASI